MTNVHPAGSPEAVVEQAFRALRSQDGYSLAAVASPHSLELYRERVHAEIQPQWHIWTTEALQAHDPHMPREVAEWRVKEMERDRARHEDRLLAQFADVDSLADLKELEPAQLLARALRTMPEQALTLASCRVIGHVRENEDRAYVLFWLGGEEGAALFEEPQVAVLDRMEGEWRLVLDPHTRWAIPGFRNIGFVGAIAEEPDTDR